MSATGRKISSPLKEVGLEKTSPICFSQYQFFLQKIINEASFVSLLAC